MCKIGKIPLVELLVFYYTDSVLTRGKIYVLLSWGLEDRDPTYRRGGVLDSMPFPPGVGGGRSSGDAISQSYEVITADRAIDESNVGNRMLRSMGWHEGSVSSLNPSLPYFSV